MKARMNEKLLIGIYNRCHNRFFWKLFGLAVLLITGNLHSWFRTPYTSWPNFEIFFLKSKFRTIPFGDKFCIEQSHLEYLINHFSKDQHLLTNSVLNPIDKQNFCSVLRMIDQRVITMLQTNVSNSNGTIMFLQIMRDIK